MPSLEGLLQELGVSAPDTNGSHQLEANQATFETKQRLEAVLKQVESRVGKTTLYGRYHRPPRLMGMDYEVSTAELGTGLSGSVKSAKSKHVPGFTCAVKSIPLSDLTADERRLLAAEVLSFMCMDHPHIARLIDVYESETHLSLVMECVEGGEIVDLDNPTIFKERRAADVMRQILLAVNYIHARGVVHRDIKPGNILFDKKGGQFVKLIDFGLSKSGNSSDSPSLKRMVTHCGTPGFMAPEVQSASEYSDKCDLWSVGVVCLLLLTGRMPKWAKSPKRGFSSEESKIDFEGIASWRTLSESAQDFTLSLLKVDPTSRMSAIDALQHRWLEECTMQAQSKEDSSMTRALKEFSRMSTANRCLLAMMPWSLTNVEQAKVRDHFMAMDKNREGTIDLDELRQSVQADASTVFNKLDSSKFGVVSYSEFLAAMIPRHIGVHDALLRASFNRFDTDCTGSITLENLRSVLGDSFDGTTVENLILELDQSGSMSFDNFVVRVNSCSQQQGPDGEVPKPACCTIH